MAGNQVYLLILVNFYAIQESQTNAEPDLDPDLKHCPKLA